MDKEMKKLWDFLLECEIATQEEINENSRARSAKLRIAEKI